MRKAITRLGFAVFGAAVLLAGPVLAQGIVSTGPFGVNGGPTPGSAKGAPYGINSPDYGGDEAKPPREEKAGSEMAVNPSYGVPPASTPKPKKIVPAKTAPPPAPATEE
jgi:hypothetical protein